VDLTTSLSQVRELIQNLEQEHEFEEEKPVSRRVPSPLANDPELIESMFETLN
jgi:hypothetical protein